MMHSTDIFSFNGIFTYTASCQLNETRDRELASFRIARVR